MSDPDWQFAVLRELGVSGTGLADLRPRRVASAPLAAPAAAAWYPEGSVAAEPVAAQSPIAAPPPPAAERQPTTVFPLPAKRSETPAPPSTPAPTQPASYPGDVPVAGNAANHDSPAAEPDLPPIEWAAPLDPQGPPSEPEPPPEPVQPVQPVQQTTEAPVVFPTDLQQGAVQLWGEPQPAGTPQQQAVIPQMSADELVRRNPHGDPLRRRMGRGMRRAVGASAAGDIRETTGIAERLGQPVPSCRRIAITSIRGGAGKTTVAALVASVIAEHRDDRVLALDADSGLGSLPLRLSIRAERAMRDLAATRPRTWEETAGYLSQTETGLWVLSGTAAGQVSELDLRTFQLAAGGVSRYFSAAVIDCGAGIVAELQRGVLAAAHAQVFVTPGTVDGALSARQTLGWFVGSGYESLLSRTIVALVAHSPHAEGDADLERARQVISEGALPVVVVPYDRHLATGATIALDRVSAGVRTAASWIAAEAFTRSLAGEQP